MLEVELAFLTVASIMVIGFVGNALFRRTGFPEIPFLLLLGILFGPVLKIFPIEALLPITPYLTYLALIMVLFNGGIEMHLAEIFSKGDRALLLGVLYFFFCTLSAAVIANLFLGMGLVEGFMLGSLVAGTCPVVIIPLVSKLSLGRDVVITLSLEAVITDLLVVVFFSTFLEAHLTGMVGLEEALSSIVGKFSIGIVLGFLAGVVWLRLLYATREEEYEYIATIAIVIACYMLARSLGGSELLSVFIFGLVLGNDKDIVKFLKLRIDLSALSETQAYLKRFQGELSFLIRSFFFVLLGALYQASEFSPILWLFWGAVFTGIDLATRYIAVFISTKGSPLASHRSFLTLMCGHGTAQAALSLIPLQYGMPNARIYLASILNLIILTNLITAFSARIKGRKPKERM